MIWNSFDYANLARTLIAHGRYSGALTACEIGLSKKCESAELHVLRARALDGLGQPNDALAACERALALDRKGPSALEARIRQALIFFDAGDFAQAFAHADQAWNLAPGNVYVHTLIGDLLSWFGELPAALGHIEHNWAAEVTACLKRFGGSAAFDGGDLRGRRVLVVHAQGFGDMLQMARYLPVLRERSERVIVECLPPIAELMRRMPGVDDVVHPERIEPDRYDAYARLMTLPRIFGIDSGIGAPYLSPDPARVESWRERIGESVGYRVGLVWGGSRAHVLDFRRSMQPERLAPLGDVPGVTYYSLMPQTHGDTGFDTIRIGESLRDFDDAAAAISLLDLVISVDTAYAHLAGALGVPVWTMLPRRPDWRWGGSGETTRWYPSMRLFRETAPGWPTVIERVASRLTQRPRERAP